MWHCLLVGIFVSAVLLIIDNFCYIRPNSTDGFVVRPNRSKLWHITRLRIQPLWALDVRFYATIGLRICNLDMRRRCHGDVCAFCRNFQQFRFTNFFWDVGVTTVRILSRCRLQRREEWNSESLITLPFNPGHNSAYTLQLFSGYAHCIYMLYINAVGIAI